MSRKIRLSDIAEQARVSTATVSRVINGKDTVSTDTKQAVLEALDLLGYERPEKLRERTGGLIGLIVPELTNPIFPRFVGQLSTAMTLQDYTPLLGTQAAGGATEDSLVDAILSHGVSGLIFVSGLHADSTANTARYDAITKRGFPFVTINGANPNVHVPDFSTDDADAIAQAIRHLTGLGHTKIGFATGPLRFAPSSAKSQAYRATMAEIHPNEPLREAHMLYTVEGGAAAAKKLVDENATAIICASDIMAVGILQHCRREGIDVPGELSVVGFDDSTFASLVSPQLTTIRQPVTKIADAAVATLLDMINGSRTDLSDVTFTGELVARETSGPPQVRN